MKTRVLGSAAASFGAMDPRADKVIGLLEKMNLSEIEKKSIRIGGA